jgi:hypothetical protein
LTNNALVAGLIIGLVTVILSGLVSYEVAERTTREQNQDAASQAESSEQTQEAAQLETAATTLYQTASSVFTFQLKCARESDTWRSCEGLAPGFNVYSTAISSFDADMFNIADQEASLLANSFSLAAAGTLNATTEADAETDWDNMLDGYINLIRRCGQIIQGQV